MQDASVGIVFSKRDEKQVLWVKRRDLPIWVLPGGGIDESESPKNAIVREIFEESSLEVDVEGEVATYLPVNRFTATTHLFICYQRSGDPKATDEAEIAAFFPVDTPPNPHFPLHGEWVEEVKIRSKEERKTCLIKPISFSWKKVGCFFLKHPLIVIGYLIRKR